jgi:hypothetical protein
MGFPQPQEFTMFRTVLLTATLLTALASPSLADVLKFETALKPTSEVPPTHSKGSGEATATLDTATHVLTWDVSFDGFSSPVTMAHFHGPAAAGKNAGVAIVLGVDPTSPIHGTATLTAAQQEQLMSGLWYVNVHTKNNPKGAIRGQMLPAK